jgi:phage terminase small subunit
MSGQPRQGSGGHNRKPVEHHLAAGTYRRDRHGPLVPSPPAVLASRRTARAPRAPEGLSAASAALWRRFHAEYDLRSTPTLELVESALRSRDIAEQAREVLAREGLTILDRHGKPRPHPATVIHRDSRAAYVSTLRILGWPEDQS